MFNRDNVRQNLPIQDLLGLAKNGTDKWLMEQAFIRGQQEARKEQIGLVLFSGKSEAAL